MNAKAWCSNWHDAKTAGQIRRSEKKPEGRNVLRTGLDTRKVEQHEQYAFWRDYATDVGEFERLENCGSTFTAFNDTHYTSSMTYSQHSVAQPSSIDRTKSYADNAKADVLAVQLRLSGQELANSFETERMFEPGDIRIMDLTQPFFSANAHYDNIGILVEKKQLRDLVPNLEDLHGVTIAGSPMANFLSAHFRSTFEVLPSLGRLEAERLSDVTLEALSAVLMIGATPNAIDSDLFDQQTIRAVRHYIRQHLTDPKLSPERIARGIGMSRAKLFRLCKPYGAPMEMVRHQRLKTAQDILQTGKAHSVEEAAYMVGYENRSSFSRAFKAEFGVSVKEFSQSD